MILPIIVLGPLYHVENGNPNQNPALFTMANSHFFGTLKTNMELEKEGADFRKVRDMKNNQYASYSNIYSLSGGQQ